MIYRSNLAIAAAAILLLVSVAAVIVLQAFLASPGIYTTREKDISQADVDRWQIESRLALGKGGPGSCFFPDCKVPAEFIERISKSDCDRGVVLTRLRLKDSSTAQVEWESGRRPLDQIESTDSHVLLVEVQNFSLASCKYTFYVQSNDFSHVPETQEFTVEMDPKMTREIPAWVITPKPDLLGIRRIMAGKKTDNRPVGHDPLVLDISVTYRGRSKQDAASRNEFLAALKTLLAAGIIPGAISVLTTLISLRIAKDRSKRKPRK